METLLIKVFNLLIVSDISFNKRGLLGDAKSTFLSKLILWTALGSGQGRAMNDNDYALKIFFFHGIEFKHGCHIR